MNKTLSVLLSLFAPLWGEGIEFTPLGDFTGGRLASSARAVSADGSVVCGRGEITLDPGTAEEETVAAAFVWTAADGLTLLPFPLDQPGRRQAQAFDLSDDGSVIVGEGHNFFNQDEPVVWTRQPDGSYEVAFITPEADSLFERFNLANLVALGISGDGSVICGRGETKEGVFEAWRWQPASGLESLGNLSNGPLPKEGRTSYSSAEAISRDGSIIVGRSWYALSESGSVLRQGFRYQDGVMSGIGDLQTPAVASSVYDISKDGSTVVGQARDPVEGQVAHRQIAGGPVENLGALPANSPRGTARGVNADGSVVIGDSSTDRGLDAFRWTPSEGMTALSELVELPRGGWLEDARAVSDDGLTIVGTIIYPDENNRNEREAYRLVLDPPPSHLADLAGKIELTLTRSGERLFLRFLKPDPTLIYQLEYAEDLGRSFSPLVSFSSSGRVVLDPGYEGTSEQADPPVEAMGTGEGGFYRIRLSRP